MKNLWNKVVPFAIAAATLCACNKPKLKNANTVTAVNAAAAQMFSGNTDSLHLAKIREDIKKEFGVNVILSKQYLKTGTRAGTSLEEFDTVTAFDTDLDGKPVEIKVEETTNGNGRQSTIRFVQ